MKKSVELRAACKAVLATVSLGVAAAAPAAASEADPGRYVTGDFHNHSTCSDGQLSVQKLVNKSVDTYGLDWFIMAGHGGGGTRNCTLVEDETVYTPDAWPYVPGKNANTTWNDSIGNARVKGDRKAEGYMYRWQSIQEIQYPLLEAMAEAKRKPIFIGLESVVPGHEHGNVALIDGQLPQDGGGNADMMAMWEYCFDRADTDLSRGEDNQWDCTVPGGTRNAFLDARGLKLAGVENVGELGHQKLLESLRWKASYAPESSYYIPAHLERAGVFSPTSSRGWNIEHLRNMNNVAPRIAFGFEGGPGHQANGNRSYGSGSAGRGAYGGAGYYTARVGGVWDALLGEGRNWFIYNNSDYHNRGAFGPDDPRSTNDQYPGEFNKTYILARTGGAPLTPQAIVDGMRTGNAYYVNGDLIDRMAFVVCRINGQHTGPARGNGSFPHEQQLVRAAEAGSGFFNPNCAQQGEKLVVDPGQDVLVMVVLRDPEGANLSPYSFPNQSLLQVGINQPLNRPVLDHVDLIGAPVTGYVQPGDPLYAGAAPGLRYSGTAGPDAPEDSPAALNPNTAVLATFNEANWRSYPGGWKRIFFRINGLEASQYLRLRGTNMPAGVPFETDSQGNPLVDSLANNIVCADAACPDHLPLHANGVNRRLDNDVEAWTDLWFYSNPVFVEVKGSTVVAGIGGNTAARSTAVVRTASATR